MANDSVLDRACRQARSFPSALRDRPVGRPVDVRRLRSALARDLPDRGADPVHVIDHLVQATDPGLVASAGPRYFGFVIGGSLPVPVAADWLTSAWDQNAGVYVGSPAAAGVGEGAAGGGLEVLGVPAAGT